MVFTPAWASLVLPLLLGFIHAGILTAQETRAVRGTVMLDVTDDPVHCTIVLVIGPGHVTTTDEYG